MRKPTTRSSPPSAKPCSKRPGCNPASGCSTWAVAAVHRLSKRPSAWHPGRGCRSRHLGRPCCRPRERDPPQRVCTMSSCSEADAQVHAFDRGSFDVVMCRFGVMFFDDPQEAFRTWHVRCGQAAASFRLSAGPAQERWVSVAFGAAVKATGRAPAVGQPGAPGPFAFAVGDRSAACSPAADCRSLVGVDSDPFGWDRRRCRGRVRLSPCLKPTAVRRCDPETVEAARTALRSGFRLRRRPWCGDGRLGMARVAHRL